MNRTLLFVMITLVLDAMGFGLIIPVMPALLREIGDIPLSDAALVGGLLSTVYAVMQFLCGPLIGSISDRYGRRPVLLGSLLVMAVDYVIMALAQTFWLLFLGRIVGGITAATQSTATAVIADISAPEEKAARFGLVGAAFGLGFVLGPMIGGVLAEYGTRAPFYAAALLAALNLAFGYVVMPETVTDKTRRTFEWKRANPLGAFTHVSLNPEIKRLLVMYFLYQTAFFVYPVIWSYFTTERFGWSESTIGLSLATFGLAMAVVQGGLIRAILVWFGDRGTVLYGLIFNTFAFIVLALVSKGWIALVFVPVTALGAVVIPALQAILSKMTADDSQGELQGVLSSISALAMIVSPLIMSYVFARFTEEGAPIYLPGAPFVVSASLMVVCIAVFLPSLRPKPA